jgi:acyl-CoA synthetase (NDP forming)
MRTVTPASGTSALDPLFAPRSVAVLGASRHPGKLGHRLLENVKAGGFAGPVYPVNPAGEPVLGYRSVAAVEALPEGVDLALVSLPAAAVPAAVKALAARRVRVAVVLSSGFGEVDAGGRAIEAELLALARAAGLRLVGPNCMGVYSAPARLNGTYFWDLVQRPGGISVVSQSGAYGGLIFRDLGARELGVARFVSIGNQIDVDIAEVVEYLAGDPHTTLIACFVEAVRDGRRFVEAAARATAAKPVVVLKGGRSEAGRRAAGSHTGSLAGPWEMYRAGCRRGGIVLADETEEFLDAIETFARVGGRRPAAPRVAIVTVSGGPSVVAADCAERSGLEVPPLPEAAQARLRALLPPFAAVGNPVDLTPLVEPARVADAVRVVFEQEAIAGAVAVNVGLDVPEFAEGLVAAVEATGKPLVAFAADAPAVVRRLRSAGVPVLPSPERAVRAWRALWAGRPGLVPSAPSPRPLPGDVRRALDTAHGALPYRLARRALEAYGVRFCREEIVASADEAVAAAERLGYPVVLKADLPGAAHKTEAGAVRVGLAHASAVQEAFATMAARTGAREFVVQEHVGPGVELLVGARRDDVFGPVVAVGLGGVFAEVIRDVSFRLAPVDEAEARTMLREGARVRLLAGPRGLPACEDAPLACLAVAVSEFICAEPRVQEVDLNPVIAAGADAVAVDAVVVVGDTP